jgi:APA family basic amino acid/polyamine antiporter
MSTGAVPPAIHAPELTPLTPGAPTRTLERTLGLTDLVLLVIGSVIGSGIFIVPAAVLRQTGGDIGPALLVWLIAGVLSLLGALTYGELGASRPDAGGLYVYIRDAFGPLPAFLYGWTTFFVICTGATATLAVAFASYLGQIVPVSPLVGKLVSIGMILVIAAINIRGTRQGASVQNWSTLAKVAGILVMSVALIARGRGFEGDVRIWPATMTTSLLSAIGLAMIGVLWAYEGWQYATFSAGEARDPQRTFPRAIVTGTAVLIGLYLLANVAYIAALGPEGVQGSDRVAATSVAALFGPAAGGLIAVVILISMFSAANGLALTAPRCYYTMARDGVFFSKLAEVHPRYRTPAFAIGASAAWAILLAATGTFEQLLTYVVFSGWIFYGLGGLSIFVFRRREPNAARTFRVPGYPLTPALFVAASAAIVVNTLATQPGRALIGLAVVLAGAPVYFLWRRSSQGARR